MVGKEFGGIPFTLKFKEGTTLEDYIPVSSYVTGIKYGDEPEENEEENEEEEKMNEVLDLWYDRKIEKIYTKYDELKEQFENDNFDIVNDFKNLLNQFQEDLEDLYKLDKDTCKNVLEMNIQTNVYKYRVNQDKLDEAFEDQYGEKRDNEVEELDRLKNEVEAQLSLSNDLKYTQEVLERYGIINKKTKKISV